MICHINCSDMTQAKQLHRKLARFLAFPEWYGHNLDALYDCLTELPSLTQLYLSGWDATAQWTQGFAAVLNDAMENSPTLTVKFE